MEDKDILIPCEAKQDIEDIPKPKIYLKIVNALSELESSLSKSQARTNLEVYSIEQIKSLLQQLKEEIKVLINTNEENLETHIQDKNDPHDTLKAIEQILTKYIKVDGSTSFTAPQSGVNPNLPEHLATKDYVDTKFSSQIGLDGVLNEVKELLKDYALKASVYSKEIIDNKLLTIDSNYNTVKRTTRENSESIESLKTKVNTIDNKVETEITRSKAKDEDLQNKLQSLESLIETNKVKWIERN